jgi:energy-coupling factor transporter ATP-binding protein EcfA2
MIQHSTREILAEAAAPGSSHRPQDALLCDMELQHKETFFPLGYPVEIITNDTAVLEAAEESFEHARFSRDSTQLQIRIGVSQEGSSECPPEPTRREYNHLYTLVADVHNQAVLDLRSLINFTWLTKAAVNNSLYLRYNFIEKAVYLLLGASAVTDIHAACVSKNGKGILLIGDSGAGKSTLAYACARAGWTFTSDDTSYLINDSKVPRAIGHSHRARFRPSAKELFPELQRFGLTPRIEGKPSIEVPVSELLVENTAAEANVDLIVYLNRSPSAAGSLIRLPHGTATERTCGDLYSAGEIRAKHEQILQTLSDIPTYELQYCDLSQGISLLDALSRSK